MAERRRRRACTSYGCHWKLRTHNQGTSGQALVAGSAKASDRDIPDTKFYDQYLKNMLQKKPPYPLLKGFLQRVIDLYPESTTWFDGGAGTCGTMEALLEAGRALHTKV
jgi:hypothetical protein